MSSSSTMASTWQKSLRRSDVGPGLPAAEKKKTTLVRPGPGPRRSTTAASAAAIKATDWHPGVVVTAAAPPKPGAGVRKVSKLSVVNEEEALEDDAADDEDVFAGGVENNGKPRRPSRSRKSTLGSVGSGTSAFSGQGGLPDTAKATKAPSKDHRKATFLSLLPKTPDLVSPLTPARSHAPFSMSPLPLPRGVKCIDTDDGSEWSYAPHVMHYVKSEDVSYAQMDNYTQWKLQDYNQKKSIKVRETLMDWIIEVLHYYNGSQEALYNTIHLIDRYVYTTNGALSNSDVQLVGVACVLIATKLEEYYAANIEDLSRLTQNSCSTSRIRKMELKVVGALQFRSYSLDPMLFLNRFIVAAQREEDPMFKEACHFFLDSLIPVQAQWAVKTSVKCAAAVLTALVLIPNTPNPIQAEEELWHPTLKYYTEYRKEYLITLSEQMIQNLWEVKCSPNPKIPCSGVKAKYCSRSKHSEFLKTPHCSEENVQRAMLEIQSEVKETSGSLSQVLSFDKASKEILI